MSADEKPAGGGPDSKHPVRPDEHGRDALMSAILSEAVAGRYDHALRRRSVRRGREKGCWL